jgi:ATP-binding cassette subfamily F protein uup
MAIISMRDVSVGFGGAPLLDHIDFQMEEGERVCLLGRNGTGKSTLLRVINGDILPDEGEIVHPQSMRVALLPQEVPHGLTGATFDIVAGGLEETGLLSGVGAEWQGRNQVEKTLSRMSLDPQAPIESLSAGLKRRVMLARGLVRDPDILLLDEPTNHLDIEAIDWMEDFLLRRGGTLLFVTHDRAFLQKVATRIVELDRGSIFNWECDYATFLERKDALLDAETAQQQRFDKKLAREEAWIRQGIKARRTRNEGRVRALEKMREAGRERRTNMGSVRFRAQDADRSGKLVIQATDVKYGYGSGQPIISRFSTLILRGDKVGIIGPNGSGKTTLLRLLLGELQPGEGTVRHGARLQIAYFDQLRDQLDEDRSVAENVGEGNDTILFNGNPRHIIGYLQDFLFSPERARSPVSTLSGGERNRLLLAKLFARPANVLVLDEPTNDLDLETLELLEVLLVEFSGTLLIVSHDRTFLNNVVTSTLVLEGEGAVGEYVGGYDDWQRQRKKPVPIAKNSMRSETQRPEKQRRPLFGFKEQRELESLPLLIETLENEQKELYRVLSDPSFYREAGNDVATASAKLESIEIEIEKAYQRWETLEALKG